MERPSEREISRLRKHAADALRGARKLPIGHARNELGQLALGLLWLDKKGLQAVVQDRLDAALKMKDLRK
jgi:hypothetical protein